MSETAATKFAPWILGVVALLFAGGITAGTAVMFKLNANVEVLTVQVGGLTASINEKTADRYTATDAARDRNTMFTNLTAQESRIKRLEDDVRQLQLDAAERRGHSQQHAEK